MSDSSFTLLEVHLGDGNVEVGPFELLGAADEAAAVDGPDESADADADAVDGGGDGGVSARSVAGLLLALAALTAVAVGVVTLRGDDEVPSGVAGDE